MSTTAKESAADCTKRACSDFKNWEAKHMRMGAAVPGSSGAGGANAAKATSGLVVPPAKPVDPPGYNQCPPDGPELGRSTWTFLHSFAAYYPKQPTPEQKKDASNLVTAVSTLYPCSSCADHLQLYLKRFPVDVNDQPALSKWMCEMHNEVNNRLGKPRFDCARVNERWLEGPSDGSCDFVPPS